MEIRLLKIVNNLMESGVLFKRTTKNWLAFIVACRKSECVGFIFI